MEGHYEFDFSQPVHRFLAGRLVDLSRAEIPQTTFRNIIYKTYTEPDVVLAASKGPPDLLKCSIPRKGPSMSITKHLLDIDAIAGLLSVDYLTSQHPSKDAQPQGQNIWGVLLASAPKIFHVWKTGEMLLAEMALLKSNLSRICVTSEQAVNIIQSFQVTKNFKNSKSIIHPSVRRIHH